MKQHSVVCISRSPATPERWREFLSDNHVEVLAANELDLSMGKVRLDDVDLILCEASGTPDVDLDLCRRLRVLVDAPLLMVAYNSGEEFAVAAYAAGADECIAGRISPELMRAKVHAWLRWIKRKKRAQVDTPAQRHRNPKFRSD